VTPAEMVREFHATFGHPVATAPCVPAPEVVALRVRLLREEFDELWAAVAVSGDRVRVAAEAADVVYVAYGAALTFGLPTEGWPLRGSLVGLWAEVESFEVEAAAGRLPMILSALKGVVSEAYACAGRHGVTAGTLDEVIAEVHRANMSKRGPAGEIERLPGGKVGKGSFYSPPDVAGVLARAGVAA
jgi:predicted HAD superfamily Cof-like phosphohydrolase